MGHHFDSPASRADSRINITDNYVFHGEAPGSVALIMAVSPLAGLPSPFTGQPQWRTFRPGCAYDFRLDTNSDRRVDRILRFVFEGENAPHACTLSVLEGDEARDHHGRGQVLGVMVELAAAWVGKAPFNLYTTVSADDHGHWTQVQRCGRPNLAATFLDDPENSLRYNTSDPDTGRELFTGVVADMTARLAACAGTHAEPQRYGELVALALLPDVIPFDPQRAATFGFAGVNRRGLRDDFGAVVYSTVFGYSMRTALAPLPDLPAGWPWLPPARPLPSGAGVAVPQRNAA